MNRPLLACAFLALASAALCAQQSNPATQSGPYAGTSAPPPDDTIETSEPQQAQQPEQPLPKPRAGKPQQIVHRSLRCRYGCRMRRPARRRNVSANS